MSQQDNSTAGAIRRLEALANEHQTIAQTLRGHAQALRQVLGGVEPTTTAAKAKKPKSKVSAATRRLLSEQMKKRWAERKGGAA